MRFFTIFEHSFFSLMNLGNSLTVREETPVQWRLEKSQKSHQYYINATLLFLIPN